jgi:hypothetical protein
MELSARIWIPAFAGMTEAGLLATGTPHALLLLTLEILLIRFKKKCELLFP